MLRHPDDPTAGLSERSSVPMESLFTKPMHLIGMTSLCYVLATVAMKQVASGAGLAAIAMLAACLAAGAAFEVLTFQRASVGSAYVAILGVESLLIIAFAVAIGEGLTAREAAGVVLVIGGTAILST